MNVTDILDMARDLTHQTVSQMPNPILIKYLNIVKNNFFSYLITSVDENYNWNYFSWDLVVWQDEYLFPAVAHDSTWLLKIQELYINYDWKTYENWALKYVKVIEVWQAELTMPWDYYVNKQSEEDPIFYIADNSVFIAPAPKLAIVNWIRVKWIQNIPDYTEATTEAELKIPLPYQDILVQWILPYIYKRIWNQQKSTFEMSEYIRQRKDLVEQLSNRKTWPHFMTLPS